MSDVKKRKDRCENCRYFVAPPKDKREEEDGHCRRYPVPEGVASDVWCGEHKPTQAERHKRMTGEDVAAK